MQVDAHKDAVDLFERYAKSGDNKDLRSFAAKHLPHLREHLKMAQGAAQRWSSQEVNTEGELAKNRRMGLARSRTRRCWLVSMEPRDTRVTLGPLPVGNVLS
jgi:hypothetical protein